VALTDYVDELYYVSMKIPRIPGPGGFSGKDWGTSNDAGKGSAPRNVSDKFKANFDNIKGRGNGPRACHTRIVYTAGRKLVYVDGTLQNDFPELTG